MGVSDSQPFSWCFLNRLAPWYFFFSLVHFEVSRILNVTLVFFLTLFSKYTIFYHFLPLHLLSQGWYFQHCSTWRSLLITEAYYWFHRQYLWLHSSVFHLTICFFQSLPFVSKRPTNSEVDNAGNGETVQKVLMYASIKVLGEFHSFLCIACITFRSVM